MKIIVFVVVGVATLFFGSTFLRVVFAGIPRKK